MSNLVHNERTKLGATFLNNIGVASIAVGGSYVFFRPRRAIQCRW
jgi:hypothetical protein